jgi:hypothetical protein
MRYNRITDLPQEKVCCKTVDILLASPRTTTRRSIAHSNLGSSTFDYHDISVSSTPPPFDDYDQFTSPLETTSSPFSYFDYHDTDSTTDATTDGGDYLSLKW